MEEHSSETLNHEAMTMVLHAFNVAATTRYSNARMH